MKWILYFTVIFVLVGLIAFEKSRSLTTDVTVEEVPSSAPADMMTATELQPAAKANELPFNVFMELNDE